MRQRVGVAAATAAVAAGRRAPHGRRPSPPRRRRVGRGVAWQTCRPAWWRHALSRVSRTMSVLFSTTLGLAANCGVCRPPAHHTCSIKKTTAERTCKKNIRARALSASARTCHSPHARATPDRPGPCCTVKVRGGGGRSVPERPCKKTRGPSPGLASALAARKKKQAASPARRRLPCNHFTPVPPMQA
jgi:hypothetical protein